MNDKNHINQTKATCPICEANAVESCNQPKNDDCPRDED